MSAEELFARCHRLGQEQLVRIGIGVKSRVPQPQIVPVRPWVLSAQVEQVAVYEEAAVRYTVGRALVFERAPMTAIVDRDWNANPLLGVRAPAGFGPAISLDARSLGGDIKFLWEMNRHLELPLLAQAFCLTGEEKFADALRESWSSWLTQCPYMSGVNWNSGMELAIRLINWSIAWQLVGASRGKIFEAFAGRELQGQLLESIYRHVDFIRRRYSSYSSANNHLIGEAAGVFVACCTWPYWGDFSRWRREAFEILSEQALMQSGPDGISREQTLAYQLFVSQFLILVTIVGRVFGMNFSDTFQRRVCLMLKSLAASRDAGGNLPMLGDSDDGRVIRLSQEHGFCAYRSAFATGALLFNDSELAAAAGTLDDQTRWLIDTSEWNRLIARASSRRGARTVFRSAGYYVLGSEIGSDKEIRLLVDCGALGYLSIAAHGHADALSICLSVAGRECLVDPGTYVYHGAPKWRAHFRGTRAHNTVTVDGQDQSVQAGSFMWVQHANAICLTHAKGEHQDVFVGEHDGYRRLRDPVTHRREIRRVAHVFHVEDTLNCRGEHDVEQWWQFSEDCVVEWRDGALIAVNGGISVRLTPPANAAGVRMYRGSMNPIAGWVSRSYGKKTPATALCVMTRIRGATTLGTTIECFPGRTTP